MAARAPTSTAGQRCTCSLLPIDHARTCSPPRAQVGLEYLLVDSRTFITNEDAALRTFFGAAVDSSTSYRAEIEVLTARLATVFTTLREMPAIRFRAAAPPGEEFPPGLESRLLVAQRLAVELHERLVALQRSGQLPERETCELILTDRGFDPVAPVIHEWTYEAMTYDLLADSAALKDNVFVYDAETQGGGLGGAGRAPAAGRGAQKAGSALCCRRSARQHRARAPG